MITLWNSITQKPFVVTPELMQQHLYEQRYGGPAEEWEIRMSVLSGERRSLPEELKQAAWDNSQKVGIKVL